MAIVPHGFAKKKVYSCPDAESSTLTCSERIRLSPELTLERIIQVTHSTSSATPQPVAPNIQYAAPPPMASPYYPVPQPVASPYYQVPQPVAPSIQYAAPQPVASPYYLPPPPNPYGYYQPGWR